MKRWGIQSEDTDSPWVARPLVGYLLDKIFAPYVCAAIFLSAALGFAILMATSSPPPAFLGAALIGIALGTEADMVTFLISRYFKLIDYSRLIGFIWVIWAWGGGVGTGVASGIYAASQSYQPAFLLFAILLLAASVIICLLGPYLSSTAATREAVVAA